VLFMI